MPVERCLSQCGRRCADADRGFCAMSQAAAANNKFTGIVVSCETCRRAGCLDCVEKLSSKLSMWLSSSVGEKLAIACSSNKERDMWHDIIKHTWQHEATGRTWRWSEDRRTLFVVMCPLDVEVCKPEPRAPAMQVRARHPAYCPALLHLSLCSSCRPARVAGDSLAR